MWPASGYAHTTSRSYRVALNITRRFLSMPSNTLSRSLTARPIPSHIEHLYGPAGESSFSAFVLIHTLNLVVYQTTSLVEYKRKKYFGHKREKCKASFLPIKL